VFVKKKLKIIRTKDDLKNKTNFMQTIL